MGKKFDFVIGNPPYQEMAAETGNQAKPVYHFFADQAKEVANQSVVMITPSRWFAGGMGLDNFRNSQLSSKKIAALVDYPNAKECFPGMSISGGVSYFVWKRNYEGPCSFTSISAGKENTEERYLDEYPVLVRYNEAVDIIRKIRSKNQESLSSEVSPISPFGLSTKERGSTRKNANSDLALYSSKGIGYISRDKVQKGLDLIDTDKVIVSQTSAEHAGEPSKDGKYRVLTSSMKALSKGDICTHSYILLTGPSDAEEAKNELKYLKTRFARFLILQTLTSIHLSKSSFQFVPKEDFSDFGAIDWSQDISEIDKQLYKKYGLSEAEVDFIEEKVKEFD